MTTPATHAARDLIELGWIICKAELATEVMAKLRHPDRRITLSPSVRDGEVVLRVEVRKSS